MKSSTIYVLPIKRNFSKKLKTFPQCKFFAICGISQKLRSEMAKSTFRFFSKKLNATPPIL